MNALNIYSYTAASNPYFVKSMAHRYGYEFDKDQPLGSVLQQIVSMEGEPALFEIIDNNPDKELFMDYFEKKYGKKPENCTCGTNKAPEHANFIGDYLNFSGQIASQQATDNKRVTTETTMLIVGGTIVLALALIFNKK
jgi:hypothetical protein